MNYVDVIPLQEPLPADAALLHLPGKTKTLAISNADCERLFALLGGSINAVEGRVVEFSQGPGDTVRIKVVAS